MRKIIAFPPIGKYTIPFRDVLERLGCEQLEQLPITQKMIDRGCKHSSDMNCWPYKYTLGYFMDALDKGANTLLMFDSQGRCRLRQYHIIQDYTLRDIGYKDFVMIPIKRKRLISSLKKANPKLSTYKILREFIRTWKEFKKVEQYTISTTKYNVGIIGEIYCCIEESLNFNIEKKICEAGMNPYNDVTLSKFVKSFIIKNDKYLRKARKYFNGPLGGHGVENVAGTLMMIEKKFDGIMWFRPLSCAPETMAEAVIKSICEKNNMPLLTIDVDETSAEANINTRIETFFELIQNKKQNNLRRGEAGQGKAGF